MQYSDDLRDLTGVRSAGSAVPVVQRVSKRSLGARQRLPSARLVAISVCSQLYVVGLAHEPDSDPIESVRTVGRL